MMLGYISFSLLEEYNILEINLLITEFGHVGAEHQNAGVAKIFWNNITFFSIVSILPILNFLYFIIKFFNMGTYMYQVNELSFLQTFTLLYRHSIFEVIALILSIYISYALLQISNSYLNDFDRHFPYRKKFKQIAIVYIIVILLTLVGAFLEGNVGVLV